jgi:hypothetical protein
LGGLVEDQHLRVTDQGAGDAEPLAHAEGVIADAALGLGDGETDQVNHLADASTRQPHRPLSDGEDLATGATRMLRGRIEEHADLQARVRQVHESVPGDGDASRRWSGEADHDPHGGRLARAIRTEEPGHASLLGP